MIIIDASRGGIDEGFKGNGIIEKDYNLMISKYIYDRLKDLGANVMLVRENDETLNDEDRANRIKKIYGDNANVVVISNILNTGGLTGSEVVYALRNNDTLAKLITSELENSGRKVNKYYQRRSESDTSKDYYNVQKDTGNIETIVVNYGYVDNLTDANDIKNNYERYAEGVVKAIAKYKSIPYTQKSGTLGTYTVQKGDSLYSISKKYGITVDKIKELNNLTSNLINIGQVLVLNEVSPSTSTTYVVQKGDSLYSISKKFDTTVDELKTLNNLTSNLININQVLKIPSLNKYIVQKGDSLYSISKKFNISVDSIKIKNNLTSNLINIGQELIV